jgi:hypothetical protein
VPDLAPRVQAPSVAANERDGASLKQLICPPLAEKAAAQEAEEAFTRRLAQIDGELPDREGPS